MQKLNKLFSLVLTVVLALILSSLTVFAADNMFTPVWEILKQLGWFIGAILGNSYTRTVLLLILFVIAGKALLKILLSQAGPKFADDKKINTLLWVVSIIMNLGLILSLGGLGPGSYSPDGMVIAVNTLLGRFAGIIAWVLGLLIGVGSAFSKNNQSPSKKYGKSFIFGGAIMLVLGGSSSGTGVKSFGLIFIIIGIIYWIAGARSESKAKYGGASRGLRGAMKQSHSPKISRDFKKAIGLQKTDKISKDVKKARSDLKSVKKNVGHMNTKYLDLYSYLKHEQENLSREVNDTKRIMNDLNLSVKEIESIKSDSDPRDFPASIAGLKAESKDAIQSEKKSEKFDSSDINSDRRMRRDLRNLKRSIGNVVKNVSDAESKIESNVHSLQGEERREAEEILQSLRSEKEIISKQHSSLGGGTGGAMSGGFTAFLESDQLLHEKIKAQDKSKTKVLDNFRKAVIEIIRDSENTTVAMDNKKDDGAMLDRIVREFEKKVGEWKTHWVKELNHERQIVTDVYHEYEKAHQNYGGMVYLLEQLMELSKMQMSLDTDMDQKMDDLKHKDEERADRDEGVSSNIVSEFQKLVEVFEKTNESFLKIGKTMLLSENTCKESYSDCQKNIVSFNSAYQSFSAYIQSDEFKKEMQDSDELSKKIGEEVSNAKELNERMQDLSNKAQFFNSNVLVGVDNAYGRIIKNIEYYEFQAKSGDLNTNEGRRKTAQDTMNIIVNQSLQELEQKLVSANFPPDFKNSINAKKSQIISEFKLNTA